MWDRWGPLLDPPDPHLQIMQISGSPPNVFSQPMDPSVVGEHIEVHIVPGWPVWGWRTQFEHSSKAKLGGSMVEVPRAGENMPPIVRRTGEILRRFPWHAV